MENLLTKRNVIIAGAAVVAIIAALLFLGRREVPEEASFIERIFPVVSKFLPGARPAPGVPEPAEEARELPLSANESAALPVGTLIRLSDSNISSLTSHLQLVRYHKNIPENLGHLFERRADGADEERRLSNFTIPQVLRAAWSPDGLRAVVFYNLDNQIRKLLIDYSTSTPRTNFLPDSVSDVIFSPDSKSLAFINDLGESKNIFIATADFRNQRKIFDNNVPGFEISWPAANTIALKTKSSYAIRGFLYTLNIKTGAFVKIAEGLGLDAVWNSDGSGALYSASDSDGNLLNLKFVDAKTGETKELSVRTIAEKCAFLRTQKNAAYCAAPRVAPTQRSEQASLPDAWWQGKVSFQDDFVLVDAQSGQFSAFISSPLDVINPLVLANDSFLLFRDKNTNNLWSLKLKP